MPKTAAGHLAITASVNFNMSIRGERFTVDFSDEEDGGHAVDATRRSPGMANNPSFSFVGDVVERESSAARPPTLPALKTAATGFPEHKKRTKISAFKQQRSQGRGSEPRMEDSATTTTPQAALQTNQNSLTPTDPSFEETELRRIDQENKQRLAAMSEDEINEERQDLLESLSPSLIERLLKRANMDQGRGDTGIEPEPFESRTIAEPLPSPKVNAEATILPEPSGKRLTTSRTVTFDDEQEPADPGVLQTPSTFKLQPLEVDNPNIHFPNPPTAPELDPSDPNFLENLHTNYFPSLPADPSKLAWMAPIPTHGSAADQDSPYYPAQEALPASALRFDFRGGLLPPRIARAMPTTKGLHHHGEAPEAAGYTVPELARLARSAFPAQRCIAFQTLGRLLYRLGRGNMGDEGSEMVKGLWRCIEEGKVVETLEEAASAEGGHQGSKTYAVEALWLWQKGGGKKLKAS